MFHLPIMPLPLPFWHDWPYVLKTFVPMLTGEDFSLTSKIKSCLKKITPPYFCDKSYFGKIGLHQIYLKNTFIKKIIGLALFLSSSWPDLLVRIFKNIQITHFLPHFVTFLKNRESTPIFSQSNYIGQKSMSLHQFCYYRPWKWLILSLNTRLSKWDLKKGMLKSKNYRHIILNLNNVNVRKANRPIFDQFFWFS